jgi:hypothetical protein
MMDRSRIAIVLPSGFDGGGSAMLGYQWWKLGFPAFFKNHCKKHIRPFPGVFTYESGELLDKLRAGNVSRIIVMSMLNDDVRKNYDELRSVHDAGISAWIVNCQRMEDNSYAENIMRMLTDDGGLFFDRYLFLSDRLAVKIAGEYNVQTSALNMNAYTFTDSPSVPLTDRDKIILSLGRGEAFKGAPYYFKAVPEIMKDPRSLQWCWTHEGFTHEWKKDPRTGDVIISGSIQAIQALSTGLPGKIQLPGIKADTAVNDDGKTLSPPARGCMNVYSTYDFNASEERHRRSLIAVCPTMGRVQKPAPGPVNLFSEKTPLTVSREDRRINRARPSWKTAMEYANIELIDYHVPVLFSTDYAETLDLGDGKTMKDAVDVPTYDWYGQLPDLIASVTRSEETYESFIRTQRNGLMKAQSVANDKIVRLFTDETI